jgi:hypothetical protein
MVTLQIIGGRKEKIRAGDVLGALTGDLGYTREQVGKINVNEFSTYVAVDRAIAAGWPQRDELNAGRVKGKSVKVRPCWRLPRPTPARPPSTAPTPACWLLAIWVGVICSITPRRTSTGAGGAGAAQAARTSTSAAALRRA